MCENFDFITFVLFSWKISICSRGKFCSWKVWKRDLPGRKEHIFTVFASVAASETLFQSMCLCYKFHICQKKIQRKKLLLENWGQEVFLEEKKIYFAFWLDFGRFLFYIEVKFVWVHLGVPLWSNFIWQTSFFPFWFLFSRDIY